MSVYYLYGRTGHILDKQQSTVVTHDGVRRRMTVGDYRAVQRSARRLAVRKVGHEGAVLDPRTVAVDDKAPDCRTCCDEGQEATDELGGEGLGFGADVGPGRPQCCKDEHRVLRLAQGEVEQELVEGARATLVKQPRVVKKYTVIHLRGALGRRQMARQVAEFPHIVAVGTIRPALPRHLTRFAFSLKFELHKTTLPERSKEPK